MPTGAEDLTRVSELQDGQCAWGATLFYNGTVWTAESEQASSLVTEQQTVCAIQVTVFVVLTAAGRGRAGGR